jgi:hypothetical protein
LFNDYVGTVSHLRATFGASELFFGRWCKLTDKKDGDKKKREIVASVNIDSDFEEIKLIYEQTSKMHQTIADFRAKLLALLPIASGVGIFLLLGKDLLPAQYPYLFGIGLFGMFVTAGLAIYEINGINHCLDLQDIAKIHERLVISDMRIFKKPGNFRSELRGPFEGRGILKKRKQSQKNKTESFTIFAIGVRQASTIVYSSVMAGWSYVAAVGLANMLHPLNNIRSQNLLNRYDILSYNKYSCYAALIVFFVSVVSWITVLSRRKKIQFLPKKDLPEINIKDLLSDLGRLRNAMKEKKERSPEHDIAIGEISAAILAAQKNDIVSTSEHLKSAGAWALKKSVDIRAKSATDAFKSVLGI